MKFFPLDSGSPRFFGFSEFLTALALMVIAWTIADIRYRFRIRTAPLPLTVITFWMICFIGVLTLLTDLWRAEEWLVPEGRVLSHFGWQAILGGLFLFTFLAWAWFAFISPPIFGRLNAKRFIRTVYRYIFNGSPVELAVIADEFTRSIPEILRHCVEGMKKDKKRSAVQEISNDILYLIADRRFCRAVVELSPGTAFVLFKTVSQEGFYGAPIRIFCSNFVTEAFRNKESFLFHETEDGYNTGYMGYRKPLIHAMYSDYALLESAESLLDPDMWSSEEWDSVQWRAYCRVTLVAFASSVRSSFWGHSFVMFRAFSNIGSATSKIFKINGVDSDSLSSDTFETLRHTVEFIKKAVEILEDDAVPKNVPLRLKEQYAVNATPYDHIANLILNVIRSVSAVKSPVWTSWNVQHNTVWSALFHFGGNKESAAAAIVKYKVRRLLYDEILKLEEFSDYQAAGVLAFCLNVCSLGRNDKSRHMKDTRPLMIAVHSWAEKNLARLYKEDRELAEACLVEGMKFDMSERKILKVTNAIGKGQSYRTYLNI